MFCTVLKDFECIWNVHCGNSYTIKNVLQYWSLYRITLFKSKHKYKYIKILEKKCFSWYITQLHYFINSRGEKKKKGTKIYWITKTIQVIWPLCSLSWKIKMSTEITLLYLFTSYLLFANDISHANLSLYLWFWWGCVLYNLHSELQRYLEMAEKNIKFAVTVTGDF